MLSPTLLWGFLVELLGQGALNVSKRWHIDTGIFEALLRSLQFLLREIELTHEALDLWRDPFLCEKVTVRGWCEGVV